MQAEEQQHLQLTDFLIDHAKDVHEYTHTVLVPQIERYLTLHTFYYHSAKRAQADEIALGRVTPWPR